MVRINLIIFFLITLLIGNASASPDFSLKGMPDIPLKMIDNSQHKLSEYIGQGKWVVLNIWGTQCPPCREEMPELVQFHDEHKNKDAIVVGIAIDFPSFGYAKQDEVISFADDYFIDFPILLSDSSITEKIGLGRLEGLPTTYMFNPNGEVVGMQVGGITKRILEKFINKNKAENKAASTKH
jgi:thiol-disulfide isomerase/thioredoxin